VQSHQGQIKDKEEVWLLVLAAGFSKRMGKQKLLLPIEGQSLIQFLVKKLLDTTADGIVVVTNSEYQEVKTEVDYMPVVVLENDHSYLGMSSSLKVGITYLKNRQAGAAVVLLADQPTIDKETINLLIENHRLNKQPILQTYYRTNPSHPVLFSNRWFDELLTISGDKGARDLLEKNREHVHYVKVNLLDPSDIDTMSDYQAFLESSKQGNQ
jgi:molybdenum cofactor cytidylyltransferase